MAVCQFGILTGFYTNKQKLKLFLTLKHMSPSHSSSLFLLPDFKDISYLPWRMAVCQFGILTGLLLHTEIGTAEILVDTQVWR
jgi:hypothetical protein